MAVSGFAAMAGLELIKLAPRLVEEGRKVYESVRTCLQSLK